MKPPVAIGKILNFWKKEEVLPSADPGLPRDTGPQSWDDDLDLALTSLLADKESKSYGTVQAITLSDFRDSIGALWEQHQEKVLMIADNTIERMLTKGQTVIREDEETWLLVTPDLSPSSAEIFAKTIATAIGEKLIGSRFEATEDVDPTPQTSLIDLSEAMHDDGSIDKGAMQHAVRAAKAAIASRAGREKRRLAHQRAIDSEAKTQTAGSSKTETASRSVQEEIIKLIFHPAWSADSQAIDSFVCRPVSTAEGDPYQRANPLQVAANAIAVMRAAKAALTGLIDDGVRAKLVVPIPLSALLSPAQNKILNILMKLEESHRFLYLRPEIVNVPPNSPPKDVLTARDLVMPVGRGVAVATDALAPNGAVMAAGKVTIGFQVPLGTGGTNTDLSAVLKSLHSAAGGRPTYVLGLQSREMIAKAAEIGFDEVGGPGLAPPLSERPLSTTPLSRSHVLAPLTN